ncbi:cytochrome P450 [Saccharopolyspora shandongensis]|uniref:cytochrome P450 n=1 Tax=Saccharopolyspora shandongensis TaxID=418495 RepID=UPI0033FA74AC
MSTAAVEPALPPEVRGLPLLGSFLEWRKDQHATFMRAYQEHGPIFTIRLGPMKGVMLIGPEHHEFFFREVDRKLSVPEIYRFTVPMFGDLLMAATDTERRRRHVSMLQSAFQGGRLAAYTEVMAEETERWLARLGRSGEFELWDTFEPLVMRIAAGALLGPEIRARIDEFRPLLVDLARGMEFILPPNLPLPRFRRRDRARRRLGEMLRPVLAERARSGGYDDFLQSLVDDAALRAEGPDVQVGMAMATLFTGYLTTAAQACWTLVQLLQHPAQLDAVVAEIDADRGGAAPGCPHAGARLPRLERAFKESLRMRPVMSHYARTTAVEYEIGGYRVPEGWLTMLCPSVAHRLPEVFADPDRYDPDRFGPERAEDKRNPHALIGFSGGFYRCPGQAFGTNETKVLLSGLLARYRLKLSVPDPRPDVDLGVTRPGSPCRIRYERR